MNGPFYSQLPPGSQSGPSSLSTEEDVLGTEGLGRRRGRLRCYRENIWRRDHREQHREMPTNPPSMPEPAALPRRGLGGNDLSSGRLAPSPQLFFALRLPLLPPPSSFLPPPFYRLCLSPLPLFPVPGPSGPSPLPPPPVGPRTAGLSEDLLLGLPFCGHRWPWQMQLLSIHVGKQ